MAPDKPPAAGNLLRHQNAVLQRRRRKRVQQRDDLRNQR